MTRQQVLDHRTCHGECPTSEPTATMTCTISWWRVADRRRWRLAMFDVGMQQSIKYCGALPCKHRGTITPNLYWTRWGTSNQCSSEWSRHVNPRSNFRVPVTTRAAAFITRWRRSVMFFGDSTNTALQPSTRDVMKAWTVVFADSMSSDRRTLRNWQSQ